MKFIKITNTVNDVPRTHLEKLGISTKRDNAETIGQFGSGIKFAPIAAVRKGMRWIFAGSDSKGSYKLEYVVKDDEGIPSIFYKYEDYEKPSSFSADAGLLSWENDFQIYREVVANAIDESKISGLDWSIDIVDESEIESVPGEFSVFISATESLMEIHNDFDKYFCVNRYPIYEKKNYAGFKLYNSIDEYFRVYCKGVLVYCSKKEEDNYSKVFSGYYDYEIDSLALNEERSVKSIYSMNYSVISALASISDSYVIEDLLKRILNGDTDNTYEFGLISNSLNPSYSSDEWSDAWLSNYQNYAIIQQKYATVNTIATIKSRGYKPLIIDEDNVYDFLVARRVTSVSEILGDSFKYEYTMDISEYTKLIDCVNIVKSVWSHASNLSEILGVYIQDDCDEFETLGMTTNMPDVGRIILINKEHAMFSSKLNIIATILHELDHYCTGETDGDDQGRIFREVADNRLAEITMRYCELQNA